MENPAQFCVENNSPFILKFSCKKSSMPVYEKHTSLHFL